MIKGISYILNFYYSDSDFNHFIRWYLYLEWHMQALGRVYLVFR